MSFNANQVFSPHHKTWHNFEYCTKCLRKFGAGRDEVEPHTLTSCTMFRCAIQACDNYGRLSSQPCELHRRGNGPHETWKYLHILVGIQPPDTSSVSTSARAPPNIDFAEEVRYVGRLIRRLWTVIVNRRSSAHRLRAWYERTMTLRVHPSSDSYPMGSRVDCETHFKLQARIDLAEQVWEHGANASASSLEDLREMYVATLDEEPPASSETEISFTSISDQSVPRHSLTEETSTTQAFSDGGIEEQFGAVSDGNYALGENNLLQDQAEGPYTLSFNESAFPNALIGSNPPQQPGFNPNSFGGQHVNHSQNIVSDVYAIGRDLQSMNTNTGPVRHTLQANG